MSSIPSRGFLCVWALLVAASACAEEPAGQDGPKPRSAQRAAAPALTRDELPSIALPRLDPVSEEGSPRAEGRAILDVHVRQVQVPALSETPRPRTTAGSVPGPSPRPRVAPSPRLVPAAIPVPAASATPGLLPDPKGPDPAAANPRPRLPAVEPTTIEPPVPPSAISGMRRFSSTAPPAPLSALMEGLPPLPAAPAVAPSTTAPEDQPAEASPRPRSPGPIITYLPSASPKPATPPAPRPAAELASNGASAPRVRPVPPAPAEPAAPAVATPPDAAAPAAAIAPGADALSAVAAPATDGHDHRGLRGFTYLPVMLGDQSPASLRPSLLIRTPIQMRGTVPGQPPTPPSPFAAVPSKSNALIPWARGFKIADNQSPMPQDRVFYTYSYFDNMNESINRRLGSGITDMQVYRQLLGFEKTFWRGNASLGLRLPIDTLWSDSRDPSLRSNNTSVGNLTVFSKFLLYDSPMTGSLLSGGLAITAPTGPSSFGGSPASTGFRDVQIQPFLGYVVRRGDAYLQGFTAIDVPTDSRDVTMWYNDVALGYFLYQNPDRSAFLSAVVPTFEVHLNDPLNHRGAFRPGDPAGTPDVLDLTFGSSFILRQRLVATLGCSFPVTGPRPFDFEAMALLNFYFGRGGMATPWPTPPVR